MALKMALCYKAPRIYTGVGWVLVVWDVGENFHDMASRKHTQSLFYGSDKTSSNYVCDVKLKQVAPVLWLF